MDADTKELLNILLENENRLVTHIQTLATHLDNYILASEQRQKDVEILLDTILKSFTIKPKNGKDK